MAMPGAVTSATQYHVHTHFSVNQSIPGLANIENRLQRLNRITNAVGRSFAVITAGVGIRRLAGAFFSIHTEIENAKVGLAGLMSAITGMPAPVALERAAAAMEVMRKAAREGPGELPEYLQSLQTIYSKVIRGGGTQADAEKLARLAVVANHTLNAQGKKTTLPIDVGQALSQGIGAYTTRHLNELLGAVDPKFADPKTFNKFSYKERLEIVTKALNRVQDANDLFSKTWSAQSDTMRDNLREIGRQASGGLFEVMKSDLIKTNELILANTDSINEWAHGIDRVLVRTYKLSRSKALDPNFRQGAAQVGGTAVGALAGRQIGTIALAAQIAKGVPGVGMLLNFITFIGAAIGNLMAKYPRDTAQFMDSLMMTFSAIGRLIGAVIKLAVTNPAVEAMLLSGIRLLTSVFDALTIFFNIIYEIVQAAQWLSDALPNTWAFRNHSIPREDGGTSRLARDSFNIRWKYNPTTPWVVPYDPYWGEPASKSKNIDELLKRMEYPEQSVYDERDITGVGDTNLNGPITIIIKAERVDNPDLVARSFREVAERFQEYKRGGRSRLVPKPG